MRVMLAGGGTGGHVYPALAMGDALRERGHDVVYIGDAGRLEGRVAPQRGYDFHPIKAPKYPRGGIAGKLGFAFSLLGSILEARSLLKSLQADLVLGVGGYISAPTVLAAWTLRIPRVIHEANVAPGLANRLCARFADLCLLTYEASGPRLGGGADKKLVGCPVNPKVLQGDRAEARAHYGLDLDQPVVMVVGGSLGAATLNALALASARMQNRGWQLLWVTGPRYHDEAVRDLGQVPEGVVVVDYEDQMGRAYAATDLVVARAGSSTLAELTALGKPAVLVPSPNVTDNHQEQNARGLEHLGAVMVLTEDGLDIPKALDRMSRMLRDRHQLDAMSQASKAQGRLEVATDVADLLESRFR
ncbi:MAG: undecaprenyldiphospho-muramoylpentapeptide beta-N-acetylglucosaminyltransferase [Proteobacteria bacterium]|nr:undecaprenyldiphospho-muramoylpentapeptide beta-N-acetylglucosaminyltransferase [Pseudomonadota bacterium]MCP4918790.1 undecaprenyldiphospho-muramoylpentapeptide beta-N-acetylglucosaminyltransferase [Pseudomonadota bacterium]